MNRFGPTEASLASAARRAFDQIATHGRILIDTVMDLQAHGADARDLVREEEDLILRLALFP